MFNNFKVTGFRIPSEELKLSTPLCILLPPYCFRIPSEELKLANFSLKRSATSVLEYLVRN